MIVKSGRAKLVANGFKTTASFWSCNLCKKESLATPDDVKEQSNIVAADTITIDTTDATNLHYIFTIVKNNADVLNFNINSLELIYDGELFSRLTFPTIYFSSNTNTITFTYHLYF